MGGWLFDWGAHTLDQILLMQTQDPPCDAFTTIVSTIPQSVEDYVNCTVTFENGMTHDL